MRHPRRPASAPHGEPAAAAPKTTAQTTASRRRDGEIRDAGRRVIKAYETTWDKLASYEDKVADKSKVDWVTDILRAQARVTRKVSRAYGSEARKFLA